LPLKSLIEQNRHISSTLGLSETLLYQQLVCREINVAACSAMGIIRNQQQRIPATASPARAGLAYLVAV